MLSQATQILADVSLVGWLVIAIGATVAGFLLDLIMREHGFGPIGNGLLIVVGVAAGLAANVSLLGLHQAREPTAIVAVATAGAAAILLAFSLLKRHL